MPQGAIPSNICSACRSGLNACRSAETTSVKARYGTSTKALWYWVDGTGRRVGNPSIWRLNPRSGKVDTWSLEHDVGALALRQEGGAVLALDDGFYFFDLYGGSSSLFNSSRPTSPGRG